MGGEGGQTGGEGGEEAGGAGRSESGQVILGKGGVHLPMQRLCNLPCIP